MTAPTSPPPATLAPEPNGIPRSLAGLRRWVGWRWAWVADKRGGGKWTKVPIDARTGNAASSTDPSTWATLSAALGAMVGLGLAGVGLVFADGDRRFGIDVDGCRDPETGELDPAARALLRRFRGCYAEPSPTGTGLHLIGRLDEPPADGTGNRAGNVEAYWRGRFFTVTGRPLADHCQVGGDPAAFAAWHRETFRPPEPAPAPVPTAPLALDDHHLLNRCLGNPKFRALHLAGDLADYGGDASAADLGYLGVVVRNGGTPGQADRLYRESAIARPKWDQRRGATTYGERTIARAFDGRVVPWAPPAMPPSNPARCDVAEPSPDPAAAGEEPAGDPCAAQRDEVARLRTEKARLLAENAELRQERDALRATVGTLQTRVAMADEQLAIYRNPNLGAQRAAGAALAQLFRSLPPTPADRLPAQLRDRRACYRVPLGKIKDLAGVSEDALSRQTEVLAGYCTPEGCPVLVREVVDIPGGVDAETGEIVTAHKELWLGPGPDIDPATFGGVLAKLDPKEKKAWGGDRSGVCPDHPDAGVVKRTRVVKRTTYECAACQGPVGAAAAEETIGKETVERVAVAPTRQDAGTTTTSHQRGRSAPIRKMPGRDFSAKVKAAGVRTVDDYRERLGGLQEEEPEPAYVAAAFEQLGPAGMDRYTDPTYGRAP